MKRGHLIVVGALLVAGSASAQPAPALEQAKKLFDVGAQSYSAGQYDAAVQAFEQAYRLVPRPALLFSLAQAERKQYYASKNAEYVGRALTHFRQYLAEVPTGGRRTDATDAIADLEPIAARLGGDAKMMASSPRELAQTRLSVGTPTPGASVAIDDGPPRPAPFSEVVKAGKHRVRVTAPGFNGEEQDVVAVEGTLVPVTVDLKEKPARVTFDAGDGADLYVDGRLVGSTPLPHPLELASGDHLVAVAKTGAKGVVFPITLERDKDRRVPVKLEKTPQRVASLVVLGTGAAGVLAGAVFTGIAISQESTASSLEDKGKTQNLTPEELEKHNDALASRDQWRTAATVTFGVSAGLLAVGTALYFLDRPSIAAPTPERAPTKPTGPSTTMEIGWAPVVSPSFLGAGAVGRF
jgi:tetratricopeptide (TPR) repeat protein